MYYGKPAGFCNSAFDTQHGDGVAHGDAREVEHVERRVDLDHRLGRSLITAIPLRCATEPATESSRTRTVY